MRKIRGSNRLVKTVRAYENWAIQCLAKAKKLHETSNYNDALHYELEADYWFNMMEKLSDMPARAQTA